MLKSITRRVHRQKKLTLRLIFVLVAGFFWSAMPAHAEPKIPPTDDAVVDINRPETNLNGATIGVGYSNFSTFKSTTETLLQFDLSSITTVADESDIVLTRIVLPNPSFDSVTVGLGCIPIV